MQGLHLTSDLRGCARAGRLMTDPVALRAHCLHAVAASGLHPVGELFHAFAARGACLDETPGLGGITGMVLLSESHLAVHTWPEFGAVTLDVYVCNLHADNSARAQDLLCALEAGFGAAGSTRSQLCRGAAPPVPT